jgi:uncharacterized protein (UPF0548 family)
MFLVRRPSDDAIRRWLAGQASVPLRGGPPPTRCTRDHNRVTLGAGAAAFDRARAALGRWEMFRLGWVALYPPDAPLRVGATVGVLVRHLGLWSLNPCRIVRLVEEGGPLERFGFAYRTLPDHAVDGEEEFSVEWSREDDGVAYDVRAWSRPRHPLAWIGLPLARRVQRRFARDSKRAMERAVGRP